MYTQLHPEKVNTSSKIAHIKYKQNHPENYKISQKTQYLKRKLADSETDLGQALNRRKICKRNPEPNKQVDNNEDEWSKFISKDRKETSENLLINLNAQNQEEIEPTNASND